MLLERSDSIFIMASGTNAGTAYYMLNLNRVDFRAGAVDQQPFGIAFLGDIPAPSGVFVQHGNWGGRTSRRLRRSGRALQPADSVGTAHYLLCRRHHRVRSRN